MTLDEFKNGRFTQVRRNNCDDNCVYKVNGTNSLEGLVIINKSTFTSKESYIRFENLDIITKY
jgi:hypothetical protein